jgi:predicted metal-dependent enzyme (double-stranded beta helix superfamily)
MNVAGPARLKIFLAEMTRLVETANGDESILLEKGREHMRALVAQDDWLPEAYAQPDPVYYRQYLLYCDPRERFSVVSFVWGPGQKTPIHDHTTWGLIGMLRGAEVSHGFEMAGGKPQPTDSERLEPGDVAMVSPHIGDVHQVANAFDDQVSISIHVYGGDIGAIERHVFAAETGEPKNFISGYSNTTLPNLWGRAP